MSTAGDDPAGRIADLVLRIYEIHDEVLLQTGGLSELGDANMLHAAAARPFATFADQPLYPTEFEQAAARFHSLIKSHPFLDGTKRTALLAALFFLESRGHPAPTKLPRDEVVTFCIEVAEEALYPGHPRKTIAEIADWLRRLVGGSRAAPPSKPDTAGPR